MRTWVRLPPGPLLYSQQGIWKDSKRGSIKVFLILSLYCISAKLIHIKEPHFSSKPRNSEEAISTKTCFRSNLCINKYRCLLLQTLRKVLLAMTTRKLYLSFNWLHDYIFSSFKSYFTRQKNNLFKFNPNLTSSYNRITKLSLTYSWQ